ncbi:MAG: hypothetical protein H6711_16245 [Myxococcales bacterium]|nr:hypothetical protein [Myxococcales bacterium]
MSRLAVFNHPDWSGGHLVKSDSTIINTFASLLDQAPAGCQVRLTVSGWDVKDNELDKEKVYVAVKKAQARGCDVKMVLPGLFYDDPDDPDDAIHWYQMNAAWKSIAQIDELFRGNSRHWPGSQELCQNINHNKFILFSQLDSGNGAKPKWVVATASCNWRDRDHVRANTLMIFSEERGLYLAFLRYWQALWMASNKAQSVAKFPFVYKDAATKTTAWFMPLPDGSPDPVVELLDSIVTGPDAQVLVSMSSWSYSSRGKTITDKLIALANAGCDVRVIAHHETAWTDPNRPWLVCSVDPLDNAVLGGYCETSQTVWERFANNPYIKWGKSDSVHSKNIVVKARIKGRGDTPIKIVQTGAINFGNPVTYGACAMAENLVQIEDDDELYQRFVDNWFWLCSECWSRSSNNACG